MVFGFENPLGLLALFGIIPLIILYLIRPKTKTLEVPSLMFFSKEDGKKQKTSFLRIFIRDLLFLLQLLIIILGSFQIASPYIETNFIGYGGETLLVLDVSASMQVKEGLSNRFTKAISEAENNLGSKNTIILVKDNPMIALSGGNKADTYELLNGLTPTETGSRIGEAILTASEISSEGTRIVVISDFINTGGTPVSVAKDVAKSKGVPVQLINVASQEGKKNIGIISVEAVEEGITIDIKNFNKQKEIVDLKINNEDKSLNIGAGQIEPYTFKTSPGITKIEILNKDDLSVDNFAYISTPTDEKIKALLITNNESRFIKAALISSGIVEVEVGEPPVLPNKKYDLYIIHDIDPKKILSGTFSDLKKEFDSGKSIIICAQDGMEKIDFEGLLQLEIGKLKESGLPAVLQSVEFIKDVELGSINNYYETKDKEGLTRIMGVDNNTLIGIYQKEIGKLVYYGIIDSANDFKLSPSYPVFWSNLISYLTDKKDIKRLNRETGDFLILDKVETIKTPQKTIMTDTLSLDNVGIYEIKDYKFSANLQNEIESDINPIDVERDVYGNIKTGTSEKEKIRVNLEIPILILLLILLFVELILIKWRGDL